MKHSSYFRRIPPLLLLLLVIFTSPLAYTQTTWNGTASNSWANSGNWSSGLPSTVSGNPSHVIFGSNDLNDDILTVDGTYYLNNLTVNAVNYGVTDKQLAAKNTTSATESKLIFQALNGVNPTFNLNLFSTATVTASRNLTFGADLELADNLTITRVGGGSTTSLRRVFLTGVVSGTGTLTIDAGSNSSGGLIQFGAHNTFTGDVYWKYGYVAQTFADSLGAPNKTIYFGEGALFTWDITAANAHIDALNQATGITYDINFHSTGTAARNILLHAGTANRQLVMSGDITGGTATTSLQVIAQANQQIIFTGADMSFTGNVRARFGTEIVVAAANASGVAWQNVSEINFNELVTAGSHSSGFFLRGDHTFNGKITHGNTAATETAIEKFSIGQINNGSTAYDAIFNGEIHALEEDFSMLNLIAESNGSATFNNNIVVTGNQGMEVNGHIKTAAEILANQTSYYSDLGLPTGTVIIGQNVRVAAATTGTGTIGLTKVQRGALLVDTPHFYSNVDVAAGATLGGKGNITGNVYISPDSILNPGGSNGDFTGALAITGNLDLGGPSTIILDVAAATFNVGGASSADIPTMFSSELETIGNHDHLSITGAFTINNTGSLTVNFLNGYLPTWGDAFHLLDFVYLNLPDSDVDYRTMWNLPNLSGLNSAWEWNFDLVESHGVIFVVPEPHRALLMVFAAIPVILRRRR